MQVYLLVLDSKCRVVILVKKIEKRKKKRDGCGGGGEGSINV